MSAVCYVADDEGRDAHFELAPLRAGILQASLLVAVTGTIFWIIWVPDLHYLPSFLPPFASVIVLALAYRASRSSYSLAAVLFLSGLAAFAGWSAWVHPGGPSVYFLGPIVVLAGILLGPGRDVVAALLLSAVVGVGWLAPEGVISGSQAWPALALIWVCTLLSYVASRPLYTALDWSWHSFVQARDKMEEARLRQMELGRAMKSLNESYLKLEQMSRELERARRVAEEARRLKAEFAANISHELRTPLNLIVGFSEMMVMAPHAYEGETLPPAYRGDISAIYKSACHLSALIDDVLDLSQIEAGRMGLAKERTSLAEIIEEAVATVDVIYRDKGLSLSVSLPDPPPLVYVDRTRIRQIVINLLNNAVRFTERGGVTIDVTCDGEQVHVAVSDTGVGIPEADLPHVFEEFRQVGDVPERHHEGSGLGLAICKRFAVLHGGSIWVESKVGAGSTFHLRLPVWDASPVSGLPVAWPAPTLPPSDRERKVVVLDGDPGVVKLFQRYLDGFGVASAGSVGNGHVQALIATASNWQEGWRKLQGLREVPYGVPLAVCVLPDSEDICRKLGVAGYLVKPVSRESLHATLAKLAKGARKLLIVDDDPEMVRLLVRMIRSTSKRYQVWRAYGGAEALALLEQRRPDAVLLDLVMPEVDGYAVLERMRRDDRLRDVPVIAVTAQCVGDETVVANALLITSTQGLSVGQTMACLRSSLDALQNAPPPDSAQEPQVAPSG